MPLFVILFTRRRTRCPELLAGALKPIDACAVIPPRRGLGAICVACLWMRRQMRLVGIELFNNGWRGSPPVIDHKCCACQRDAQGDANMRKHMDFVGGQGYDVTYI